MNQRLQRGLQNAELLHYLISNQVEILQIRENDKSKYELHAILKWKSGVFPVITTRGKAREWSSLDRMVKHLRTNINSVSIDCHLKIKAT